MAALAHFAINVLTMLFFIGLVGSALVILISFGQDITELFGHDESTALD